MLDLCLATKLLPAQVAGAGALPCLGLGPLPVDPTRLVLLIGWFYLCMYCVLWIQSGTMVPDAYKTPASLITLVTGPVLPLILLVIAAVQRSRQSQRGFFEALREQWRGAWVDVHAAQVTCDTDDSVLQLVDPSGRTLDEIYGHGEGKRENAKILDLTETVVADAIRRRASDILIDPRDESTYAIRLRIDGILRTVKELQVDPCRAVINSVKVVAGMDIAERRRPQDGAFLARQGEAVFSFRVASAGALNGEKLSIRILNKDAGTVTLTDLGMSKKQVGAIQKVMQKPAGMILICGPTGSGKTTTMYAALNCIDRFERNTVTVEDPVEAKLPETSQIEINPRAEITFAKTLRSVVRQDPDVICVGEIRDEETAEVALRAAQTGHLVLSTLHCDNSATALIRLLDLGVSPLLLSSGLSLIISQRLLRCLCPNCKQPAQLSESQIAQFRQKRIDSTGILEPGQCKQCDRTGYYQRTVVCDLLAVDDAMKRQIVEDQTFLTYMKVEGAKKSHANLRKQGMKKVVAGITSLEELKRIIG